MGTYLGQGVTLEIRSSTASVIPLTSSTLPSPFHSVENPCRWLRRTITGSRVNGVVCERLESWFTCTHNIRFDNITRQLIREYQFSKSIYIIYKKQREIYLYNYLYQNHQQVIHSFVLHNVSL